MADAGLTTTAATLGGQEAVHWQRLVRVNVELLFCFEAVGLETRAQLYREKLRIGWDCYMEEEKVEKCQTGSVSVSVSLKWRHVRPCLYLRLLSVSLFSGCGSNSNWASVSVFWLCVGL